MRDIFDHLLRAPLDGEDASAWELPFDHALSLALRADRLGYAFAAGYHAALRALVPSLGPEHRAALCATEAGGAHPKHIAARLDGGRVTGEKRWVTGGASATALLVLCVSGENPLGRKDLRLVWVDADAPGVSFEEMPAAPFVPEVPHASVRFEGAPARAVLDGDGWEDLVKPFRTVEDAHVHGAALAYLLGWGRRAGAPESLTEALLAGGLTFRALAAMDPRSPAAHLALAGAIAAAEGTLRDADAWVATLAGDERARWERDRALLSVASRARALRRERAWAKVRGENSSRGVAAG